MRKPTIGLGLCVSALLLASASTAALAETADKSAKKDQDSKDADAQKQAEIVVTGVFGARAVESAPISISVVSSTQLSEQPTVSAADLLKNIPGVFVNSSLGEIRNVVFSRGISANSLDGAGGYYYVSLQEDGLPVEVITSTNYGPDYFSRPDLGLGRVEGLRGGTAAITGPNAPGGIFNYISKTGKSDPGFEIDAKVGMQGDGANPYYRVDGYAGGKLNNQGLYYSIAGYYRWDRGAHDPGYAMDKGGQIHGNILYDYSTGSLLFTFKYLNDSNDWNEFTPSIGGTSIAPGFTNSSSDLPPANGAHCFPNPGGSNECWNPTNLVHSRSYAAGLNWKQDFGDGWHFDNKVRYTRSTTDWNTGALISAIPIDDVVTSFINDTSGLPAGTVNYYFHNTGALASSALVIPTPFGFSVQAVTTNNLPNQSLLAKGVYSEIAFVQHYKANNFVDQATFTKEAGNHHLAVGGYVALADLTNTQGGGGVGFGTLTNQPQMLVGTFTSAATGTVYQLTDPTGFTALGTVGGDSYHGKQNLYSAFFGDTWKVTPRLTIDGGGRFESVSYDVFNQSFNASSSTSGADGNPLTLYDNHVATLGTVYETKRSYHYFNYSASAAYNFSSNFDAYLRYTNGKKAPDFGTIQGINTPGAIATDFIAPQGIQQIEMGLKLHRPGLDLQVFPFYSKLTNVTTPQTFTYTSGPKSGQFYSPVPVAGQITTYGVEMSLSGRIASTLTGRGNLTLQSPKAKNFGSYSQGPKGDGSDDVVTLIPEGDADNNPKIIVRAGLDWTPLPGVKFFGNFNYLGKRAANEFNAFYLPGFATVDLGGSVAVTSNFMLQLNVANITNKLGVMSWSQSGGILASIDRQGLTKANYNPAGLYPVVPVQPRAIYLTAKAKF